MVAANRFSPFSRRFFWISCLVLVCGLFVRATVAGELMPCTDCVVGSLPCDGNVGGTLSTASCDFGDNTFVDFYRIELSEETNLRIELSSTKFDPNLGLFNGACQLIFSNDDCTVGDFERSCLNVRLQAGTYFAGASASNSGATGAYQLTLDCNSDAVDLCAGCVRGPISLDGSAAGVLSEGDCPLGDNTSVDLYSLELASPVEVTIEMTSMEFDTSLVLLDDTCSVVGLNDDCAENAAEGSCIIARLEAGNYFVGANSLMFGEGGAYNVTVSTAHREGGLQRAGDCNQDDNLDLSDGICLLATLFLGGPTSCDQQEAFTALMNVNGDGSLDLSDAVTIFSFLFLGGPPPEQGLSCILIVDCPDRCN